MEKVKAIQSREPGYEISGWEYKGIIAIFYPRQLCHKVEISGVVYKIYSPDQLKQLVDGK